MNETKIIPVVGMGATISVGSDRYPYTVCEVITENRILIQADDYRRTDKNGVSESQEYEYTPQPDSLRIEIKRRKDPRYLNAWFGKGGKKNGERYYVGSRRCFQDPSF